MEENKWHCNKCKKWFGTHIDIDYHENTVQSARGLSLEPVL